MSEGIPSCPRCQTADGICGVLVRGVYDGTLYWECMECGTKMHRWPEGSPYRERADKHLASIGRATT